MVWQGNPQKTCGAFSRGIVGKALRTLTHPPVVPCRKFIASIGCHLPKCSSWGCSPTVPSENRRVIIYPIGYMITPTHGPTRTHQKRRCAKHIVLGLKLMQDKFYYLYLLLLDQSLFFEQDGV